jgi:Arc/MetJ family transcription regulator
MRTTLNIDEKLLEEIVKATGEKTRSKAVNKALDEYIRGMKIDQLRAMAGRAQLDDVRSAQMTADERRQRLLERLRDGPA